MDMYQWVQLLLAFSPSERHGKTKIISDDSPSKMAVCDTNSADVFDRRIVAWHRASLSSFPKHIYNQTLK